VPSHVALLRGVNNLGSNRVAMAELRELVASLGHADVLSYIQSGNLLFTPLPGAGSPSGALGTHTLAVEMEHALLVDLGVRARVVVLSRGDLARCVQDNPYPEQTNPRLLHAVFLPDSPPPDLGTWLAEAEHVVQAGGARDQVRLLGRTVYLHTPDGYPGSELRRYLARSGGPTSPELSGTARNWATVSRLLQLCRS
jgi:uncharacterized protein (DUF1697 family)